MKNKEIKFLPQQINKNVFNRIGIPTKEGLTMVSCDDIVRCEVTGTKSTFYLLDGEIIKAQRNINFFEEQLAKWNFFRIHKSNLINIGHVQKYLSGRGGKVILTDETVVDVSIRKRSKFLQFCTTSFEIHSALSA